MPQTMGEEKLLCSIRIGTEVHSLYLLQRDWAVLIGQQRMLPGSKELASLFSRNQVAPLEALERPLGQMQSVIATHGHLFAYDYWVKFGDAQPTRGGGPFKFLDYDATINGQYPGYCYLELIRHRDTERQYYCGMIDIREFAFGQHELIPGIKILAQEKGFNLLQQMERLFHFVQSVGKGATEVEIAESAVNG